MYLLNYQYGLAQGDETHSTCIHNDARVFKEIFTIEINYKSEYFSPYTGKYYVFSSWTIMFFMYIVSFKFDNTLEHENYTWLSDEEFEKQ